MVFMALPLQQYNTASVYTRRTRSRDNINMRREWATVGRQRNRVSIPGRSNRFFSSLKRPDWLWFLMHYIPGVKWLGREADH